MDIINNRYQMLEEIGKGGMGAVYRAHDRLTQQIVALKLVIVPGLDTNSRSFRLALAQEFKVLASLRHPNLISVLDYGFHEKHQPFVTLELLPNPRTLTDYGQDKPLEEQVALLVQVLQAIAYLHRRGILHRDLKPDNVLVVDGQVKVLDFGLAVAREHLTETEGASGTIAYMSPEVLQGHLPTEASDLYAVGVMAYELFAGQHPFNTQSVGLLIQDILTTTPEVWGLKIGERLTDILTRLLAKDPQDRFSDANQLIQIYAEDTGYETEAIRESYLQAAAFVGRERELKQLTDALSSTLKGKGGAWLIGGESGVGKSRLLDELRTQALVAGALVMRGQAITEAASPFHIWHNILRRLVIQTDLTNLQAGVLKPLVPDISRLLGREVPDAPEIDAQVAQNRLLSVIEEIFRQQTQPILLLLEDIQWAGEGLTILKRLNRIVTETSLMIVANYRDDEAPHLQLELAAMNHLKLQRLNSAAIADLSASMLGETGRQQQLVELLQHETEGNIFFIVEVVRNLAEEAGQLAAVGSMNLPASVAAGGIEAIIRRRLNHVPDDARSLLYVAAIAGRELDPAVLQVVEPRTPIEKWLTSVASVIDVQDNRYRFAHDKLREGLLRTLKPEQIPHLHQQVAQALETVHPADNTFAAALAFHWGQAGDSEREARFSLLAAKQAISESAYRDALLYLNKLESRLGDSAEFADLMGQAQAGTANMVEARAYWERAVHLYGYPVLVKRPLPLVFLDTLRQLTIQILHRRGIGLNPPADPNSLHRALNIYIRLMQIYGVENIRILDFFNFVVRWLNRGDLATDATVRALSRSAFGMTVSTIVSQKIGAWYLESARALESQVTTLGRWSLKRDQAIVAGSVARWDKAIQAAQEGIAVALEAGDSHSYADTAVLQVVTYLFAGRIDEATQAAAAFGEIARKSPESVARMRYLYTEPMVWVLRGEIQRLDAMLATIDTAEIRASDLLTNIAYDLYRVIVSWHCGDDASNYLRQIVALLEHHSLPLYSNILALSLASEIAFRLWEQQPHNQERKQTALALYAKLKTVTGFIYGGRPLAARLAAWQAHIQGRPSQRHFEKSIALARQYHMPYDEALAHYHYGRSLPPLS